MILLNNKVLHDFGFYSILTNPILGYETLTEVLVANNVPYIQLRIKNQSDAEILQIAKNLSSITKDSKSNLIINDSPQIAIKSNADGIHIGQDDMVYQDVRDLVGDKMIIGLSTHNIEQVKEANLLKPNYIGMGPVYKTPTKKIPDPVLKPAGLKAMMDVNELPYVAIGGIDFSNIEDVLAVGAKNLCAVRLINECLTKQEVLEVLKKINLLFH